MPGNGYDGGGLLDTFATGAMGNASGYFGVKFREPTESELAFFKRTGVPGYAAPDNAVVLNPSPPQGVNMDAVAKNEAARVFMRQNPDAAPKFGLTDEQSSLLSGTTYKGADPLDRRSTIAARLLSGDPSGGTPTPEQAAYLRMLRAKMGAN